MPRTGTSRTPPICPQCGGTTWVRRITTHPVRLTEPASLAGKEIHVHRVALQECQTCGCRILTPAGRAKVERCVTRGIQLFLGFLS